MSRIAIKPMDAAWFYVERHDAPVHFGPLMILTPPEGSASTFVRDFVERWRQCKVFAPPFNYRWARTKLPSWEVLDNHEIDLDYHFRHSALPAPGGERELGILVSRLQSHKLDRRRPLWELHVIEGLEGGRFAIYMKLHHGQLDGMGSAKLVSRTFSQDPKAIGMLPPWAVGMQQRSTVPARFTTHNGSQGAVARVAAPFTGFPKALRALTEMGREAYVEKRAAVAAPFQAPVTILNRRIGSSRRFATQRYELARFKTLAKAANVSVNDVFLCASAGALRRYLLELGALPGKSLVGQVPVNIRPAGDASVGNAIAFICARLHTHLADPVERLQAIRASTEAGKQRQESLPREAREPFTMMLLGPYMAQLILGLGGQLPPAMNLVISNVSGPRERLYFNGARLEHIYGPSVLFHGQALNITMASYCDEVNISYTGCRDSLPSMQKLAVYTGEAMDELEQALGIERS